MRINTSQLTNEICSADSMDKWEQENGEDLVEEMSLADFLSQMLEEHEATKNEVIKLADIDTVYAYQIFQGKKQKSSRDKLIRLALAWPLTVGETKRLLSYGPAGTLYPRVRRDAYLMYAIHNRFTVLETDRYLFEHGEAALS